MGNCIKPSDPLIASLPRGVNVDTKAIRESGLPIIFVIGGPGVGKRTLCAQVAKKYGFHDIISTDVIQHEMSKRTEKALVLARLISKGQLVPSNVEVELIAMKMLEHLNKKGFIVSGFPQRRSEGKLFDKEVRPPDLVLMLNVRNSVMSDRLMARSVKTTERFLTDFEYIKAQIKAFHKQNKLIVKYYGKLVVVIDAEPETMTVFEKACEVIDNVLVNFPGFETTATASTVAEKFE